MFWLSGFLLVIFLSILLIKLFADQRGALVEDLESEFGVRRDWGGRRVTPSCHLLSVVGREIEERMGWGGYRAVCQPEVPQGAGKERGAG